VFNNTVGFGSKEKLDIVLMERMQVSVLLR
jgi:hypothetical protein